MARDRNAIGVPITAAALLETIFVSMASNNINDAKTPPGGNPYETATKTCAIYSAPPVIIIAEPRAREAATIRITWVLSADEASCQSKHLVNKRIKTPQTELISIGKIPNADDTTTANKVPKAIGALLV